MKKALSLVLALIMVAMMAFSASAATVTIPDELAAHTFTAYPVFSASADTDGVLTDIQWGTGIDSANFLTALKASDDFKVGDANVFADSATAEAVAKAISANPTLAEKFAALAYEYKTTGTVVKNGDTLAAGYYLLVDTSATTDTNNDGVDEFAYNAALLEVTGDSDSITISVKTDKPIVEKKVLEETYVGTNDTSDYGYTYGDGYNDVADYDMGDTVPFALYSKVPDMTYFETYKMVFHDTMSSGLTLNANSFTVKVGDTTLSSDEYTVNTNPGNNETFTVTIHNLKAVANVAKNQPIVVSYTAVLNQDAVVGLDGNPNEVYLQYTNNPNDSAPEVDSDDDGVIDNEHELGTTVTDYVIVFTYELDVTKVNGEDTDVTLANAKFVLQGVSGYAVVNADNEVTGWVADKANASVLTTGSDGTVKVIGLDDGTYSLIETAAPTGYNLLTEAVAVVIDATTTNGQTWTVPTASTALTALAVTADGTAGTASTADGTASITVANFKGSTLPETGGIGTTVFYIVGGLLMLAAVVVLVARKKTANEE